MRRAWMLLAGLMMLPASAQARLYWNHRVRDNNISICFVGDAVSSRASRVAEVLNDIQEFEYAAHVNFNYLGACPAPVSQANGDDYFDGDIRIVLNNTSVDGTGIVPGEGCGMFLDENGDYKTTVDKNGNVVGVNDGWGSWSNASDDLELNRACMYNLKLGDDPWNSDPYLNHTLHEVGHALGLAHEHARADVDLECTEVDSNGNSTYGGSATSYITEYDSDSVMHYKFTSCGIDGNYGVDGFSELDKLSVHVLYPEAVRVAEYIGTTVVKAGSVLSLDSAWLARGGDMAKISNSFAWKLNGSTYSTGYSLDALMSTAGDYSLSFTHKDFLGRSYSTSTTVRVLTAADFNAQVAGPVAASLL